ncbi:ParA family protein [Gluconacetobacter sp. 1c LMG 22058]|uniref:ParA family protein n=1 Tax=Gluconacetobacter dulcium TaxID=2729096 RepID=A0A7W4K1C5_9PROT|nr:ParA family protein [Gluconacetobacter dulcium]MBB2198599.1 ParA family protein [Gluconacetobacter dulcium]
MTAKILTIFNNKGGVGKTTLTYHLANAFAEIGRRVLLVDLDPQCNLTITALEMEEIHKIWEPEDDYIEDFSASSGNLSEMIKTTRSIHFILKPTEDGKDDLVNLPPPYTLGRNLSIIPGRLTLHRFEAKVSERWNSVYSGDPLAIRTITNIRSISHEYARRHGFDIIIFDTSPSLGALNKNILTLADAFLIPCTPDLFSVYGIRNIGQSLKEWRKQFETVYDVISSSKRNHFPDRFVKLIGYTIYNAKKYDGQSNEYKLAKAHNYYAQQIPRTIREFIPQEIALPYNQILTDSIGGNSVIHTHNTFPSMAQRYHNPMWNIPEIEIESDDQNTVRGNAQKFRDTQESYHTFANDVLSRMDLV